MSVIPSKAYVQEIFERFRTHNPHPQGELVWRNPFTLLVAVVLSAQATDVGVNKVTPTLFDMASTPQDMVALGEDRVAYYIRSVNYYRTKARHLIALSEKLLADFGGEVPQDREALESLPGVGRKTANVVLNIAFQRPTFPVDTHIFRLSHRLGLSTSKTPQGVEADLEACVPSTFQLYAHHWMILHGRYICKARKPLCDSCLLRDLCPYQPLL